MTTHLLHTNSVFEINTYCSFFFYKYSWHGGMITTWPTWKRDITSSLKKKKKSFYIIENTQMAYSSQLLKKASYSR